MTNIVEDFRIGVEKYKNGDITKAEFLEIQKRFDAYAERVKEFHKEIEKPSLREKIKIKCVVCGRIRTVPKKKTEEEFVSDLGWKIWQEKLDWNCSTNVKKKYICKKCQNSQN